MVFWPRCPKQGIQFDLPLPYTGSEPVLNRVWYYKRRDLNPECEHGSMVFRLIQVQRRNNWVLVASSTIYFSNLNGLLNNLNSAELESVNFVTCPKKGLQMEAVVLHRVGFLEYFCPKQGQDFKPSAAPLYLNMGQVPPKQSKANRNIRYIFDPSK